VLARHGALAFPIDGVEAALAEARRRATPAGTVIVTGSLHLVGAVRALLRGEGAIGDDK